MRAFVAIDLDSSVRARVEELARELEPRLPGARFLGVSNLHFTLRFLGDSEPARLDSMAVELERAVSAIPAFALDVKGCGVFPNPRRARILWISVEKPPELLFRLQRLVERTARSAGFVPEERRFEPHVTIARFREPASGLEAVLAQVRHRELGRSEVEDVVIYESRLSPKGATYTKLHRISLSATSGTDGEGLV